MTTLTSGPLKWQLKLNLEGRIVILKFMPPKNFSVSQGAVCRCAILSFNKTLCKFWGEHKVVIKGQHNCFLGFFTDLLSTAQEARLAGWRLEESDLKTQASFVFYSSAKVLRESRGSSAEEFCYFDGRSGLPTLCISAMILVALKNNSLINVLCNRKYFVL